MVIKGDAIFARRLNQWMVKRYPEARNKSNCIEMLANDLGCSVVWVWHLLRGKVPGRFIGPRLYSLGFRMEEKE